ncbi:MAG: HAD family hydrolase [Actinomycetota bacterium]
MPEPDPASPLDLSRVRAVTFDCWATLIRDRDFDAATKRREAAITRLLGVDADRAAALLQSAWDRHHEAWKEISTFGPGRMAVYCAEQTGVADEEMLAELTGEFEEATLATGVEAVDGAEHTLRTLQAAGIRRALVCDTGMTPGRVVRWMLGDVGLLPYLETLCFSDEVGVPKPDAGIFAKALAELGAKPEEALHVGDLKRTDIAGARSFGMAAVRFRGAHDDRSDLPDAEAVIDRLPDLLQLLGVPDPP